jgi:hypothetical protein
VLILIKLHGMSGMPDSSSYSGKYDRKRSRKNRGVRNRGRVRKRYRLDGALWLLQCRGGIEGIQGKILSNIADSVNHLLVQTSLYDASGSAAASLAASAKDGMVFER